MTRSIRQSGRKLHSCIVYGRLVKTPLIRNSMFEAQNRTWPMNGRTRARLCMRMASCVVNTVIFVPNSAHRVTSGVTSSYL